MSYTEHDSPRVRTMHHTAADRHRALLSWILTACVAVPHHRPQPPHTAGRRCSGPGRSYPPIFGTSHTDSVITPPAPPPFSFRNSRTIGGGLITRLWIIRAFPSRNTKYHSLVVRLCAVVVPVNARLEIISGGEICQEIMPLAGHNRVKDWPHDGIVDNAS